jgi:hypothetical protein
LEKEERDTAITGNCSSRSFQRRGSDDSLYMRTSSTHPRLNQGEYIPLRFFP